MAVDYLSCGTCFISFYLSDINQFIEHKKRSCYSTESKRDFKTRTSNTDDNVDFITKNLECVHCSSRFSTPWSLLMHAQIVHNLSIIDNLKKAQLLKSNLVENKSQITLCSDSWANEEDENKSITNEYQNLFSHPTNSQTQSSSVSTQTDLSVLRKRAIPHRKRKYFECCTSETALSCNNSASSVMKPTDDSTTCCDSLPTRLCPCTPSETSPVGSTVCVRSYCCPSLSVYNQSKCVDIADQSLPESDSSVSCTNNVSNCCLGKPSCCAVPTRVLSVCCNQTIRSSPTSLLQTNPITVKPVSCCPCPPAKLVTSNSSEAQTDFDPEFSYSDYVDLAMLLASPEEGGSASSDFNLPTSSTKQHVLSDTVSSPLQIEDVISLSTPSLTNSSLSLDVLTSLQTHSENTISSSSTISNILSFASETQSVPILPKSAVASIASGSYLKSKLPVNNYLIQTKSRTFVCSDCGAAFRQNVHLRKHIMIQHTKQKPYQCSYCSYTTVEKSHLTVHVRTHTGERPFRCRVCTYSSAQNCTLKSHYLRKHPQQLVYCNSCSQGFLTELEMSRHKCSSRVSNDSSTMLLTN